MDVFNLNGDEWDRTEERDGWRSKDAWVGAHVDAELIGGSMYELEPVTGCGRTTRITRTRSGWWSCADVRRCGRTKASRSLTEGDVVCFRAR